MTSTLYKRVKGSSGIDDYQTPPSALDVLYPYLLKDWLIWECACGAGQLVAAMKESGYRVIGTDREYDFLTQPPPEGVSCIVTNQPYSIKDEFIARCYLLELPFALLMPLNALEGKGRQKHYRENGLQIIIPDRRIHFAVPSGKTSNSWFQTAWFTNKLNLPNDIVFCEMKVKRCV